MSKFVENQKSNKNKKILIPQIIAYSVALAILALSVFLFLSLNRTLPSPDITIRDNIWYKKYGDGWEVVNMDISSNSMLELPAQVEGKDVLKINRLSNCENIKWVDVPETVIEISDNAFSQMPNLTYIQISEKNKAYRSLDGVLFDYQMKNLIKVPPRYYFVSGVYSVPLEVVTICERAFFKCESIIELRMLCNVQVIMSESFYGCVSLKTVNLTDSKIAQIGANAFSGCINLEAFKLPKELINFGISAFTGCTSITGYWIDEENIHFEVKDGVIYSKDMVRMISYPAGKTDIRFNVPNNVERIESGSLCANPFISRLDLPVGLKYLSFDALKKCSALKAVVLMGENVPDTDSGAGSISETNFYVSNSLKIKLKENAAWSGIPLYPANFDGDYAFITVKELAETDKERYNKIIELGVNEKVLIEDYQNYAIVSGYWGKDKAEIPDMYDKAKVVGFTSGAFNSFTLTKIKFNSYITYIGNLDFRSFVRLQEVEFGSGIQYIGDKSFLSCGNLLEVKFTDATLDKSALFYIGTEAFANCTKLGKVELPKLIQDEALGNKKQIYLGKGCFSECGALKTVVLYSQVIYANGLGVKVANSKELQIVIPNEKEDQDYYRQQLHYFAWSISDKQMITLSEYEKQQLVDVDELAETDN
ncbi:MAG: leucine-rich repeat domain-containing protein, partial [Clostridia bacterium]